MNIFRCIQQNYKIHFPNCKIHLVKKVYLSTWTFSGLIQIVLDCIRPSFKVYSIWTNCILVVAIIQLLLNKTTLIRKGFFLIFSFILLVEQTFVVWLKQQIHDLHTFPGRWFMTNWSSSADMQPINMLIWPVLKYLHLKFRSCSILHYQFAHFSRSCYNRKNLIK